MYVAHEHGQVSSYSKYRVFFKVFWICVVVHMDAIMSSHISHQVFDDQNLVQTVNNICGQS